jgi:predicted nucleic acid-binding protein
VTEVFFDTRMLLYLLSSDDTKADVAEATIAEGGHVSVQVLNEFVSVARHKARLDWSEIDDALTSVRRICRASTTACAFETRFARAAERSETFLPIAPRQDC